MPRRLMPRIEEIEPRLAPSGGLELHLEIARTQKEIARAASETALETQVRTHEALIAARQAELEAIRQTAEGQLAAANLAIIGGTVRLLRSDPMEVTKSQVDLLEMQKTLQRWSDTVDAHAEFVRNHQEMLNDLIRSIAV